MKRRFFLWLSAGIAGRLIRLLKRTVTLTVVGEENLTGVMNSGGKAIFVFWHGNMSIPLMRHIDNGVVVLVSEHGDGEIISRILNSLGCDLVRGSTTRGGARALKDLMKRLKSPGIIAITPDGPTGPYRTLKIGAVILAHRTNVPIIPMSAYTNKPRFLKSWDRFHVVIPFTKCVLMYGEPVHIERDLNETELEEKRKHLEALVRDLDGKAETFFEDK